MSQALKCYRRGKTNDSLEKLKKTKKGMKNANSEILEILSHFGQKYDT